MANPTTNYGFVLPTSTDLVTDLPADFDIALQGVDTRLKALQPGTTSGDLAYSSATANTNVRLPIGTAGQVLAVVAGVPAWSTTADQTPLTTKGDLFTFTTTDARLGVGANGETLVADSSTATGLKWAAPASGGGMTVLASGNLATGTGTTTLSSISTAYNDLRLVVRNLNGSGNNLYTVRVNGDTGANYSLNTVGFADSTAVNRGLSGQTSYNSFDVPFVSGNQSNILVYDFYDYANTTTRKLIKTSATFRNANTADNAVINGLGGYSGANAAITSISLTYASNVNGGTYILYGVK